MKEYNIHPLLLYCIFSYFNFLFYKYKEYG